MIEMLTSNHPLERQHRHIWAEAYQHVFKRIGDLVLCAFLLSIAGPLIAFLYFLARLDGGPGFYGHVRIGKSGRLFKCWKIRTMADSSEEQLATFLRNNPQAQAEWDHAQKLRHDPRITRFGHVLRQSSLDELPQIWNVLRGEMSFVGPRPVTKSELTKYGSGKRAYLALRPGISGLWQVSGRNDVSYEQRVLFDISYQENVSWLLDTQILLRTILVVMQRNGV